MNPWNEILVIEARLKEAGVSVDDFCRQAQVDRATWQRWKSRKCTPRLDSWMRVQAALPAPRENAA